MINTPANLFQHCRSFTETTILPKYRLIFHMKLSLTADLHSACKMHKRTLNLLIGLVLCIWSCDHYNVQSLPEGSFIQAVALSYQSGDSVAYHTIPNFFTYRYSQTILLVLILQHVHHQKPICVRCSVLIYNFKILIFL